LLYKNNKFLKGLLSNTFKNLLVLITAHRAVISASS
jgi:hypothetical protein